MVGKRPPNFSWVEEGVVAGCAYPHLPDHYAYLVQQGILLLVSLTEWKPPVHLGPSELKHVFMPVTEFEPPSLQQLKDFTALVEEAKARNQGVAVHCHWGRGRTGTMLAAYLVKSKGVHPIHAISEIRRMRPYSIETWEQEQILFKFADSVNKDAGKPRNGEL